MSDGKRTARPNPRKGFRLVGPLAGPPVSLRPVVFSESQRRAIRRVVPVQLSDRTFSEFIWEIEQDAALFAAFRQRTRLPEAAIMHRLSVYKSYLAHAATALRRVQANADLADYLQPFVRQAFTEEEYWQSIVRSAVMPAKGVRIDAVPGDDNFERVSSEARERVNAQAQLEGRLPLKRVSIEEQLAAAETSLKEIENVLNQALSFLRQRPRKGGRRRDLWRTGFVSRLANIYQRFVGRRPTSTSGNDFHRLMEIVFEALKWPRPDHRMILGALRDRKGTES